MKRRGEREGLEEQGRLLRREMMVEVNKVGDVRSRSSLRNCRGSGEAAPHSCGSS